MAIARALHEEPPLPGASTEGWTGLAPADGAMPAGHMHMHHSMEGMDMSGMDMSGMDMGTDAPAPTPDTTPDASHGGEHAH